MIKKIKKQFLTTTVLFSLLLTSCFYLVFTLPVYGLETNTKIEAMTVLNDVFGLTAEDYSINSFKEQSLDYRGLLKNETDFILASSQSKVRVTISYVDNVLHQVFFSGFEGKLAEEKPVNNTYEEAKNLLINYQNYVGDSLYGELASMLDNVDVNKNITKANGNKRLTISNFDQKVIDYVWRYIDENGCVAKRKSVTLSYDRGQLKLFLNNWPLYKIVGTPEITGEEATAIALEASKTYSFEITTDNGTSIISGFDISPNSLGHETMSYLNFPNETYARGGDPFTLYPSWHVPIGFTKFYPGNLAGMTVTVWADTGEVSTTNPMVVNLFPLNSTDEEINITPNNETTNSTSENVITDGFDQNTTLLSISITSLAIFSLSGISVLHRRKIIFSENKKTLLKLRGTLLCGTILLNLIFAATLMAIVATPIVNADETIPNSMARIYAAYNSTPNQPPDEIAASEWVCAQIEDAFEDSGYSASNLAGENTNASIVGPYAASDENNYDRVAVYHFGHQASPNWGYQDNYNKTISYADLNGNITSTKHKFVFIWVCRQAVNQSWGIPSAWTQRTDMSADGYVNPDSYGQCYIGFDWYSPMIGLTNGTFKEEITGALKYFIDDFYDNALRGSRSVRDALNLASQSFFGDSFTSSILYTGYNTWWPGGWDFPFNHTGYFPDDFRDEWDEFFEPPLPENNTMKVFGDGSMWLFQPKITLASNHGSPTFYLNGDSQSLGDVHVWSNGTYSVSVGSMPGYTFDHFNYHGGNYGQNPSQIALIFDGTLAAYYNPIQYSLTISSGDGGDTDPSPGTYYYSYGTNVQVSADPDTYYEFDYWNLDGNYYSDDDTETVTMNSNHNLQAIFTYVGPSNNPPNTPTLSGPSPPTYINQTYQFSASATDPDGDNVYYTFYWDDATQTTVGPYTSGTTGYTNHTWSTLGQKSVTVRAHDVYAGWSSSSSPYTVNIIEQTPSSTEIGIWHLDEGSGTIAIDISSYGNNGTIYGASWTVGQYGNALSFDGNNDYVEVDHDSSLAGFEEALTVYAWIKMDDVSSRQSIVHKYDTQNDQRGWFIEFNSDNIQFLASDDGSSYEYWGTSFEPTADTWYHIAVVWESDEVPIFYINGQPSTTWGSATISSIYNNSGAPLHIGKSTYNDYRNFDGVIDEVYIFSRALSAQEIEDAAEPQTSSSESGIWYFYENSGSIAHDNTSNDNDGSIYGASWTSGQVDYALRFDGYNDYVRIDHDDSLAGFTDGFTVQAWIRMDDNTSRQSMVHKYDTSNNQRGWFLEYDDTNLKFFASANGVSYEYWGTVFYPNEYTWYHVAVVWESDEVPIFYINGQSSTTWGSATISSIYNNSGAPLDIGRSTYNQYRFFDGKIDELYIYSEALSAQEIENYYNSTN